MLLHVHLTKKKLPQANSYEIILTVQAQSAPIAHAKLLDVLHISSLCRLQNEQPVELETLNMILQVYFYTVLHIHRSHKRQQVGSHFYRCSVAKFTVPD